MSQIQSVNYLSANNFGLVQQPVPVNQGVFYQPSQLVSQPMMSQVPLAVPTSAVQTLIPAPLPVTPTLYQIFPNTAEFSIFTPSGEVKPITASQYCTSQNGNFVAPQGWSFMTTEEFFNRHLNLAQFPSNIVPLLPSNTTSPSSSPLSTTRSPSVESIQTVTTEQSETTQKTGVKRPHRSKQIKIAEIHELVKEYCEERGMFANEKEVLRGMDVLRIHVKTWEGLDLILGVIKEVESCVQIARIALPFSMKNKFQKKGFICYMKVQDVRDVEVVQEIFSRYSNAFKKCDVALPSNKEGILAKEEQVAKLPRLPIFDLTPPSMAKSSSAA